MNRRAQIATAAALAVLLVAGIIVVRRGTELPTRQASTSPAQAPPTLVPVPEAASPVRTLPVHGELVTRHRLAPQELKSGHDALELVRFEYTIASATSNWVHFRVLPPAWRMNGA